MYPKVASSIIVSCPSMVWNELDDAISPIMDQVIIHSFELRSWDGLRRALPAGEGFVLVDCAGSPLEALQFGEGRSPCVVLIDCAAIDELDPGFFRGKVGFGHSVRVLAYGTGTDSDFDRTVRYLELGCMGLLSEKEMLKRAVQAVSAGEVWAPRRHIAGLLQRSLTQLHSPALTPREEEILRMITKRLKNAEIAEKLGVTRETIRWHIRGLYSKIGVEDRPAAVSFGERLFSDCRSAGRGSVWPEHRVLPESKPPSSAEGKPWEAANA